MTRRLALGCVDSHWRPTGLDGFKATGRGPGAGGRGVRAVERRREGLCSRAVGGRGRGQAGTSPTARSQGHQAGGMCSRGLCLLALAERHLECHNKNSEKRKAAKSSILDPCMHGRGTYYRGPAHPTRSRRSPHDVHTMKLGRWGPPWWGVGAVPAPPGHRCDRTGLPVRP